MNFEPFTGTTNRVRAVIDICMAYIGHRLHRGNLVIRLKDRAPEDEAAGGELSPNTPIYYYLRVGIATQRYKIATHTCHILFNGEGWVQCNNVSVFITAPWEGLPTQYRIPDLSPRDARYIRAKVKRYASQI